MHDPFPIPIRWRPNDVLSARRESIVGKPGPAEPVSLTSQTGQVDEIVEVFARVPSGRLVVLGEAGAGKSILASRFVLASLNGRAKTRRGPVPVIFSVGSWDPSRTSFRDWLTSQLVADHPTLAATDGTGTSMAAHLIGSGRIIYVLDGFDEITEGLRAQAVRVINVDLEHGHRLLLTSRPAQYAAAVHEVGVLSRAEVIELDELRHEDLVAYLPNTINQVDARNPVTKWHVVLDRLSTVDMRVDPVAEAVAAVLRTPLMVALARAIYSDTDADPADLFTQRSGDLALRTSELEDRLLAGFVPAVYLDVPPSSQLPGARRWGCGDVTRWLRFLATAMNRQGTTDFEWWHLINMLPRGLAGFVVGSVMTLSVGAFAVVTGVFADWDDGNQVAWLLAALGASLCAGMGSGVIVAAGLARRPAPSRAEIRIWGRSREIIRESARAFATKKGGIWLTGWSIVGMAMGAGNGMAGMGLGLAAGLAAGTGIWLVEAIAAVLGTPVALTETISPVELLRLDRRTALWQAVLVGAGGATVLWLVVWLAFQPVYGLPFAVVFGNIVWFGWLIGIVAGVLGWTLLATLWGPWLVARYCLALTHKLPLNLMEFLNDAHQLGVLRQAGGVYQFRHARLQAHLGRLPADP